MTRISILALFVLGCTDTTSTIVDPILDGDTCLVHFDQTTCGAATGCSWGPMRYVCPANAYCSVSGECDGNQVGSSGSYPQAECLCNPGDVCFEQVGGTAQPASFVPQIKCTTPLVGTGDACSRVSGQGRCTQSFVGGLCVCDNGIR